MKKTELLLVVFLLFFFQQVLFPTHRELKVVDKSENREIKTRFEESNCFSYLFGDINPGENLISVSEAGTKYFSPDSKFKNLQTSLFHTSTQCSLKLLNSVIFGSSSNRIFFIPIYLQSENFRL